MTSPAKRKRDHATEVRKRRAVLRALPYNADDGWHGTCDGYTNHCCRCERCSAAYKTYYDKWRKRPDVAERRRRHARDRARLPGTVLAKKAYQYGLGKDELEYHLAQRVCFACGATNAVPTPARSADLAFADSSALAATRLLGWSGTTEPTCAI